MCENDSSCSSQQFFPNLILMILDIVILEYGHDVSSYMVVQEMKIYTLHQLLLEVLFFFLYYYSIFYLYFKFINLVMFLVFVFLSSLIFI